MQRTEAKDKFVLVSPKKDDRKQTQGPNPLRGSGKKTRGPRLSGALPPELECTPVNRCTLRFNVTQNSTARAVSVAAIAGSLGAVATVTNSTVSPICSAFRIRKVVLYSSENASAAAVNQASLQWASSFSSLERDEVKEASIPDGMTVPKRLVLVPPKQGLASFWVNSAASGSVNVLSVTANQGSIIDLHIDFILSNAIAQFPTISVSTAVLGQLYYLPLDGASGHILQALGRPGTF